MRWNVHWLVSRILRFPCPQVVALSVLPKLCMRWTWSELLASGAKRVGCLRWPATVGTFATLLQASVNWKRRKRSDNVGLDLANRYYSVLESSHQGCVTQMLKM